MYNYNPYQQYNYNNNNYINELQQMRDKIDKQIQQAQQPQPQQPIIPNQQPSVTQNFQLAPASNTNSEIEARYAESIEEVKNTFVMKTGIFITKDCSTLWIKNVSGDIKAYKLEEIKQLDEKDMQIQQLQDELNNMKILMSNAIQQTQQTQQTKQTSIDETSKVTAKSTKK